VYLALPTLERARLGAVRLPRVLQPGRHSLSLSRSRSLSKGPGADAAASRRLSVRRLAATVSHHRPFVQRGASCNKREVAARQGGGAACAAAEERGGAGAVATARRRGGAVQQPRGGEESPRRSVRVCSPGGGGCVSRCGTYRQPRGEESPRAVRSNGSRREVNLVSPEDVRPIELLQHRPDRRERPPLRPRRPQLIRQPAERCDERVADASRMDGCACGRAMGRAARARGEASRADAAGARARRWWELPPVRWSASEYSELRSDSRAVSRAARAACALS